MFGFGFEVELVPCRRRQDGPTLIVTSELTEGGTSIHDCWHREVVQRRQGLRFHPARVRRGRLRALQRHPDERLPLAERGPGRRVRRGPGPQGPPGGQRAADRGPVPPDPPATLPIRAGSSSCDRSGVELEPAAGALLEGRGELLAGGEAEDRGGRGRDLRPVRRPGLIRVVTQPRGNTAPARSTAPPGPGATTAP